MDYTQVFRLSLLRKSELADEARTCEMKPFVFSAQTQQLHAARKKRQQQLNEVMPAHQHERIAGKDEGAAALLWKS